MIQSIIDDIRGQFKYGNKVIQIILFNFIVFLAVIIIRTFTPGGAGSEIFSDFLSWIALPSGLGTLITRPWTLLSHMFVHQGMWHVGWNMIMLYWFGKIVGDLIGDNKIVPLYITGGLFGALFYLFFANVLGLHGIAYGASAAVMSFVVASGFLAPEYNMRLLLFGDVKLKYIVLVLVFVDLIMITEANNTGGRIAHLGGALFGGLYIYFLRQGTDLVSFIPNIFSPKPPVKRKPAKMKVIHGDNKSAPVKKNKNPREIQAKVDEILDKINESGYDSLSAEDKDILYQASKNQ